MSCRQVIYLTPYWPDIFCSSAIQPHTLVKDEVSHGFLLHIVIIAYYQRGLLFPLFLWQSSDELFPQGFECIGTFLFCTRCFGNFITFVVAIIINCLPKLFVICLMAILTFNTLAGLFHQLQLCLALDFYLFVGKLDGFQHLGLANFLEFSLYHHYIVQGTCHHNVNVRSLEFGKSRINNHLSIDPGNPHFRDRSVERNIAHSQCCRCGKACKRIRHDIFISRYQVYCNKDFGMVIFGEKWAKSPVYQPGY
ncbi:hypothetical protein SDC9_139229 [bioreactor metagenome]|uniref:Uncharacterized protein n=1 Tax=bioreactor metagenome TaxID=1076179 RepID=A0A645DS56_9ZZZZ